jgi:hypothetical protein
MESDYSTKFGIASHTFNVVSSIEIIVGSKSVTSGKAGGLKL